MPAAVGAPGAATGGAGLIIAIAILPLASAKKMSSVPIFRSSTVSRIVVSFALSMSRSPSESVSTSTDWTSNAKPIEPLTKSNRLIVALPLARRVSRVATIGWAVPPASSTLMRSSPVGGSVSGSVPTSTSP